MAHKPDNQFAEAAKKLAEEEQRADANAAADQQYDEATAANAPDQAQENAPDQAQENATPDAQVGTAGHALQLDNEEKMAAEQWLRRIPDDPGGLLRRKFLYQYQQRAQQR